MTMNPTPRVDVVCAKCSRELVRFYMRDDRLTMDSRHRMPFLTAPDAEPVTVHQEWFRGIDVEEELNGVMDSQLTVECACRIRDLSVAQTADQVRQVWNDARRVTRLPV